MGRIKSKLVKRTSNNLLKKDDIYTPSFETNKKILTELTPSKKIRNQVAGYLARIKKRQEKKQNE